MAINFTEAVSAYQRIAGRDRLPGLSGSDLDNGSDFAKVLSDATEGAIGTLREAESQSLKAAIGEADLTDVVTAVSKAELTLETVVTLRNRVIQAYQEIFRMPI